MIVITKHAFDSAGRLYNQEGKLEKWWTNFTSEGFKTKQDCIVKQYSGTSFAIAPYHASFDCLQHIALTTARVAEFMST